MSRLFLLIFPLTAGSFFWPAGAVIAAGNDKLTAVYDEIQDFQERGLPYGFQVQKFLRLQEKLGVNDSRQRQVRELLASAQREADKRRATCAPKMNLRKPLALEQVKSQDSENWCYAFTASDLVANATGMEPSAVHLGLHSTDYIRNPGDGFVGRFIEGMKRNGFCTEASASSRIETIAKHGYDRGALEKSFTEMAEKIRDLDAPKAADVVCREAGLVSALAEVFPGMSLQRLAAALVDKSRPLAALARSACEYKSGKALGAIEVRYLDRPGTHWKEFDRLLDQGHILGIEYDSGMLEDYRNGRDVTAGHASSIIGRRFNEKTLSCEYLLRNSWGRKCDRYGEDYECAGGNVWIAESFFQYNDSIRRAIYIEAGGRR